MSLGSSVHQLFQDFEEKPFHILSLSHTHTPSHTRTYTPSHTHTHVVVVVCMLVVVIKSRRELSYENKGRPSLNNYFLSLNAEKLD